jgi:signal transduction histidine kinase
MTRPDIHVSQSLQPIIHDLQRSINLYRETRLDLLHDTLLKAFIDIIHNDHSLDRFFQVCVTIPPFLGDLQAEFYLYNQKTGHFLLVCTGKDGLINPPRIDKSGPKTNINSIIDHKQRRCYPLYPRSGTARKDPQPRQGCQGLYDPDPYFASHSLLGLYVVLPAGKINDEDSCFFKILTRWMGNKLNNRLIANRHMEHLQFLNSLGRDIGHNIIVPNMQLKYLLRQMEKQLDELRELEEKAQVMAEKGISAQEFINNIAHCRRQREALEESHRELLKHHTQISLFLESLFREQHFKQGHLVLKPSRCFVERDIILPQLELYKKKLERRGITIEKPVNLYHQDFPLMVDVGLLSQVYANLFSNAVKYTEEIIGHRGTPRKALAYGAEMVNDFPDPGRKGIKFNVFTTGPPLSEEERQAIFQEGSRLANSDGIEGSGHGLDFIRRVLEVHGGRVGCEATPEGNNFYFILPISQLEEQSSELKQHDQRK